MGKKKNKNPPEKWESFCEDERFVRIFKSMFNSPAFISLTPVAKTIYLILKNEYRDNRTMNNVKCPYSAIEKNGISRNSIPGALKPDCFIIAKGEVYEQHMFTPKDEYFKSREFVKEAKHFFTDMINEISQPNEKLKVFNQDSPYLATKKIGKHNPHEKEIREDNKARDEWNRQFYASLKYGIPEESMKEMKQSEIIEPIRESMATPERNHSAFRQIVLRAVATARNCTK